MIAGVLLAAGRATRFGGAKLLAALEPSGDAVAAIACRNLVAALPLTVAVVRPGDAALADALARSGARVVGCPDAERGMGASLACGVAATIDAHGWIVALADMPWVRTTTTAALARCLAAGAELVAPFYRGRRGHPVGFGRACLPELLALSGEEGARRIVDARHERLQRLDVEDAGCVRDVDRPEDLAAGPEGGV